MTKKPFSLTKAYTLLEPGPVTLIAECHASLECIVADTRMVNKYNFFVLEIIKAWVDPAVKNPQTPHHRGNGEFIVAGKRLHLPSRMK